MSPDDHDEATALMPRADVYTVDLDDEVVLYEEDTGRMHVLNPSAAVVWHRLDGATPLQDIANDLATEFAVDGTTMLAHVTQAARGFAEAGLLAESLQESHDEPTSAEPPEPEGPAPEHAYLPRPDT